MTELRAWEDFKRNRGERVAERAAALGMTKRGYWRQVRMAALRYSWLAEVAAYASRAGLECAIRNGVMRGGESFADHYLVRGIVPQYPAKLWTREQKKIVALWLSRCGMKRENS